MIARWHQKTDCTVWTGPRVQNDTRFHYHDRNEVQDDILLRPNVRQAIGKLQTAPHSVNAVNRR